MERFFDKLALLACCTVCALVSLGDAASVVAMLLAAVFAFAQEAVPARHSQAIALGLSGAYGVVACAVPACAAFLPLFAYDVAGRAHPGWIALAAVPLFVAATSGTFAPGSVVLAGVLCGLGAVLALRTRSLADAVRRSRKARDELQGRSLALEAANRELAERQEREARLAVLEERGRIAREIHDNVGHLLTRAILQVEAYQVVHAGEGPVRDEFSQVGATLHEALNEVRASVHGLRDDSIDLSVQVAAIADGCPIPVAREVSVEDAPPEVAACLCAIVREALSNTARHSDASTVRLSLVEHPGLWQLSVRDDGTVPPPADAADRGMGLQSMEERVRRLGGTFRSGYRAGFEVFASIPKDRGAGGGSDRRRVNAHKKGEVRP